MGYGIRKYVYFKKYWIWQLVLDGVVNMDVGYKASDPVPKHYSGVFISYFILHSKVRLKVVLHVILLKETI